MTDVIVGGLIVLTTSLATLVATRIFDSIQKKKEHEYSLGKAFFDRKLQAVG